MTRKASKAGKANKARQGRKNKPARGHRPMPMSPPFSADRRSDMNLAILALAHNLLGHARANECLEEYPDGAWVHSANCPNYCGYACGAVWISYTKNADDEIEIREVHNSGTVRVMVEEV